MSAPPEILLTSRLSDAAARWFGEALAQVRGQPAALSTVWSGAGRRLGPAPITLSPAERDDPRLTMRPDGWGADEYGRALLLLAVLQATPDAAHLTLVDELFTTGELRERQAVLRVLPHLPAPERFVDVGVEAVRNNATSVIEAIACENPYPAAHFPEPAFNQLVLKCLFCGLSLERVRHLSARVTPELQRMVSGYASERRAAGRAVPDDVALVLQGVVHAPV